MNHYRIASLRIGIFIALFCILTLGLPNESIGASNDCGEHIVLDERQLSRCDYANRLRAMWLGETIANWTGLTTEAVIQDAPFYTDDDWGLDQGIPWKQYPVIDFVFQDPWLADDDTDKPLQMFDFILTEPVQAQEIRVTGNVGGLLGEVIVLELAALASTQSV